MSTNDKKTVITVRAIINAPVEKVWNHWTDPMHIIHWNNASDDWHTPRAENELRVGGKFLSRMEAKDGSFGFDFTGKYTKVEPNKLIEYILDDGRKVQVSFSSKDNQTTVTESFEAEELNSVELQQNGWQSILDNFKKYVEASGKSFTMKFEIYINARVEKVFKTMLDDKFYREWTSPFNPSSYFKGSWEKGSKILFLGTDSDGKMGGMVSKIKENIPNQFVSIEHLGVFQDGKEVYSGPEVDTWAGALENYTFHNDFGKTILLIDLESPHEYDEEFKTFFLEAWPKALKVLKAICETPAPE